MLYFWAGSQWFVLPMYTRHSHHEKDLTTVHVHPHPPHADCNHFTCASFRLSLSYIWPHFWLLDPSQTCGCLSQRQTRGPWHLLLSGLGMRVRTGDSKRMGRSFPSKFSSVKEEKRDMYQPLHPLPFSLPYTYRECDLGPEFQTLPKEGSLWKGGN